MVSGQCECKIYENFLSLTDFQGGSVGFGNRKIGEIVGIGKGWKFYSHEIKNMYIY